MSKQISIIGSGNIGGNLAKILSQKDCQIRLGVRDLNSTKLDSFKNLKNLEIQTVDEAINSNRVLILAIPGNTVAEFCEKYKTNLSSKIIIDTTNTMFFEPGNHISNSQILSQTGAKVAKAFNSFGFENLENPEYADIKADHLICGDPEAVEIAKELSDIIGFNTIVAGGLENAVLLENMARLWGTLAYKTGLGRQIGWKLLIR